MLSALTDAIKKGESGSHLSSNAILLFLLACANISHVAKMEDLTLHRGGGTFEEFFVQGTSAFVLVTSITFLRLPPTISEATWRWRWASQTPLCDLDAMRKPRDNYYDKE